MKHIQWLRVMIVALTMAMLVPVSVSAGYTAARVDQITPSMAAQADGLESYTGPVYEYSLEYDPEIWELASEFEDDNLDGLRLVSDNGRLTIFVWDQYGTDTVACLDGEVAYYTEEDDSVTDMEIVINANGEEMRYEGEDGSWAVYTLTYTQDGESYPLVDYFDCRALHDQDAMMVIMFSASPERYNDGLDETLDVLDTLNFGDDATKRTETPEPTAEPQTDAETTTTSLDGSFYTSPNYGFTVDVPLEWEILGEETEGTNERLILGNGTSEVTLWATSDYSGNLAGCVDWAAQQSGLDLSLDTTSTGGDFRGVYRNEAYANFVYEDGNTQMLYFVSCQPISDTNGFLILIQDVEYEKFSTERRPRTDIENNITMP